MRSQEKLNNGLLLTRNNKRLELQIVNSKLTPIYVDFLSGKNQYRRKSPGKQLIAKAVGIKTNYRPQVLDATAGLGQDAYALACLGCKVQMLERSPIIGALLEDGLLRAKQDKICRENLNLIIIDAIKFLTTTKNHYQVIYLDPMYPEKTKTALSKKSSQVLRKLVGDDQDAAQLLTLALRKATNRVVVKRPKLAKYLGDREPDLQFTGSSTRFDVYLLNPSCQST